MKITRRELRRIVLEIMNTGDKTVIAIYPGRFQPMGKHHLATYDWMVKTFGKENSYIASSDKVCPVKSPFCFDEKKQIAIAHGVPDESFINERSPYVPKNILSKYDPESTSVVFVVGQKDMMENPRFRVGMKKRGGPTYFQHYKPGASLDGFDKHGYLAVAPHQDIDVGGVEMSGTRLRQFIPSSSPEEFKDAMGFDDYDVEQMIRRKLKR